MYKFIKTHILTILNNFQHELKDSNNRVALDRYMSYYLKSHKSLGSDERSEIAEKVYGLMRYKVLLDYLVRGDHKAWEKKLDLLYKPEFFEAMGLPQVPEYSLDQSQVYSVLPEQRVRLKQYRLFQMLARQYGVQRAMEISEVMNHRAPLTLRINPLKISRDKFVRSWRDRGVIRTELSPLGAKIVENKKFNLLETNEFKDGFFEIQDEASQLAALQIDCKPGDLVLDFCAGSGGKSLAIAHRLQGKGQIFLHDPRQKSIQKAKNRMQKAGVTNVQYHTRQDKIESTIRGKVDWLVLDMPCTGTGTIRRNPDIKVKFSPEWLRHHVHLQEEIFFKALKYLAPRGRIVYITCSILQEENQDQIQKFISLHKLKLLNNKYLPLLPEKNGMDGFFAAVLHK